MNNVKRKINKNFFCESIILNLVGFLESKEYLSFICTCKEIFKISQKFHENEIFFEQKISQSSFAQHVRYIESKAKRGNKEKICVVSFSYTPDDEEELTVIEGEHLEVVKDHGEFLLCRNVKKKVGFVPLSFVEVINVNVFYGEILESYEVLIKKKKYRDAFLYIQSLHVRREDIEQEKRKEIEVKERIKLIKSIGVVAASLILSFLSYKDIYKVIQVNSVFASPLNDDSPFWSDRLEEYYGECLDFITHRANVFIGMNKDKLPKSPSVCISKITIKKKLDSYGYEEIEEDQEVKCFVGEKLRILEDCGELLEVENMEGEYIEEKGFIAKSAVKILYTNEEELCYWTLKTLKEQVEISEKNAVKKFHSLRIEKSPIFRRFFVEVEESKESNLLEDLPTDLVWLIMLYCEYKELFSMMISSKLFYEITTNENFWKDRVKYYQPYITYVLDKSQDFEEKKIKYKDKKLSEICEGKSGVAMFDFEAEDGEELAVAEGETVEVVNDQGEWLLCRNLTTQAEGYVPTSYIEINDDILPNASNYKNRLLYEEAKVKGWKLLCKYLKELEIEKKALFKKMFKRKRKNYLSPLKVETIAKVMLYMPDNTLFNFILTCTAFSKIISDGFFWKERMQRYKKLIDYIRFRSSVLQDIIEDYKVWMEGAVAICDYTPKEEEKNRLSFGNKFLSCRAHEVMFLVQDYGQFVLVKKLNGEEGLVSHSCIYHPYQTEEETCLRALITIEKMKKRSFLHAVKHLKKMKVNTDIFNHGVENKYDYSQKMYFEKFAL